MGGPRALPQRAVQCGTLTRCIGPTAHSPGVRPLQVQFCRASAPLQGRRLRTAAFGHAQVGMRE